MIWWMIGAVLFLLLAFLVIGTVFFLKIAFFRNVSKKDKKKGSAWERLESSEGRVNTDELYVQARPFAREIAVGKRFLYGIRPRVYSITSYDGLKLKARFIPTESMRAIVILVHGFRSNPVHDFAGVVQDFNSMGIACLLPDQRATGESEGKYICYGRKEKYDIRDWARLMDREYNGVPVILDGVSMGATTVLLASGLKLPENVKGIIADCGFTTAGEMFEKVLKDTFKLPKFPFFYTSRICAKLFLDFDFYDEPTEKALENNRLPILFAHGKRDTFVPYGMSVRNYRCARRYCHSIMFSVEEADHGLSYLVDKEGYTEKLGIFFDRCL